MTELQREDLEDILNGACILACGGGGPYGLGEQLVEATLKKGAVDLVDPTAVDAHAHMAVSAGVGSPDAAMSGPMNIGDVAAKAYTALADQLSSTFTHVTPGEVGAGNSFVPMYVAAALGLPLVDVSGAPRAMPLFNMTSYEGHVPVTPVMVSNGTTQVSYTADENGKSSSEVADATARAVISTGKFGQVAGVAMFSMTGEQMRAHGMTGTMTRALDLGRTLRAAKDGGDDPVEAVANSMGGKVLFMADEISQAEHTGGGFDTGFVKLTGKTKTVTLVAQNENIFGWRSDRAEPIGLGPDFLCYLTEDGQPFSNAASDIEKYAHGKRVALIGVPASNFGYRTPEIVDAWMGAINGLGYVGEFVPIEQLPSWGGGAVVDVTDRADAKAKVER